MDYKSPDILPTSGASDSTGAVRDASPVQLLIHVLDSHGSDQEPRTPRVHIEHPEPSPSTSRLAIVFFMIYYGGYMI